MITSKAWCRRGFCGSGRPFSSRIVNLWSTATRGVSVVRVSSLLSIKGNRARAFSVRFREKAMLPAYQPSTALVIGQVSVIRSYRKSGIKYPDKHTAVIGWLTVQSNWFA